MVEVDDLKVEKALLFMARVHAELADQGLLPDPSQVPTGDIMTALHHNMLLEGNCEETCPIPKSKKTHKRRWTQWDSVCEKLAVTSHFYSFCEGVPKPVFRILAKQLGDSSTFKLASGSLHKS
ncbi:hypothetical protein GPECTOR_160g119 [Gonium pectorale]|uniref:Uncharacterized protein n=1 Tax=Gonium pectorale TaxID=33097 RepID=A0A150FXN4_GONPE|nr:hypothetical protein GPECTOR_160g119 [Gonium pectorale]|eukprot:KXZ42337.1 hypothetical protein GPECTOR_160g119 [Gonium pectorale]